MQIFKQLLLTLKYIRFYNYTLWFVKNIEPQNLSINPLVFFFVFVFFFTFFQSQSHVDNFKKAKKKKKCNK